MDGFWKICCELLEGVFGNYVKNFSEVFEIFEKKPLNFWPRGKSTIHPQTSQKNPQWNIHAKKNFPIHSREKNPKENFS
jgi:hypothetical protein